MKTKRTLKDRLVSGILALTMLASFLPGGWITPAYADDTFAIDSLEINSDTGAWTIVITGTPGGEITTGAVAILPNFSGTTTRTSRVGPNINSLDTGTNNADTMNSAVSAYVPTGSSNAKYVVISFDKFTMDASGTHTFTSSNVSGYSYVTSDHVVDTFSTLTTNFSGGIRTGSNSTDTANPTEFQYIAILNSGKPAQNLATYTTVNNSVTVKTKPYLFVGASFGKDAFRAATDSDNNGSFTPTFSASITTTPKYKRIEIGSLYNSAGALINGISGALYFGNTSLPTSGDLTSGSEYRVRLQSTSAIYGTSMPVTGMVYVVYTDETGSERKAPMQVTLRPTNTTPSLSFTGGTVVIDCGNVSSADWTTIPQMTVVGSAARGPVITRTQDGIATVDGTSYARLVAPAIPNTDADFSDTSSITGGTSLTTGSTLDTTTSNITCELLAGAENLSAGSETIVYIPVSYEYRATASATSGTNRVTQIPITIKVNPTEGPSLAAMSATGKVGSDYLDFTSSTVSSAAEGVTYTYQVQGYGTDAWGTSWSHDNITLSSNNSGFSLSASANLTTAATYTVNVRAVDQNDQADESKWVTSTVTITVNPKKLPTPVLSHTDVTTSGGSNGTITITNFDDYPAGTTFTISPSAGSQTDGVISGLSAGTYTITAIAPNGNYTNSDSASETVEENVAAEEYTVSYNGNGSTGGTTPTAQTYTEGDSGLTLQSNTFTKTGYSFAGWSTDSGTSNTVNAESPFTPTGDTTLYAVWAGNTITYNGNGATVGVPGAETYSGSAITVDDGSDMTPPTGKTFAGWKTAASSGTSVPASTSLSPTSAPGWTDGDSINISGANITLYAQWDDITYTVTYQPGDHAGDTNAPTLPTSVAYNGTLTLPANTYAAASGYHFDKWSVQVGDADAVEKGADESVANVTDNVVATALWAANTPKVQLIKDGSEAYKVAHSIGLHLITEDTPAASPVVTAASTSTSTNEVTFSPVPNGTYAIFVDGANSGETIVVNNNSPTGTVYYYTVTKKAGTGTGDDISEVVIKGTDYTLGPKPGTFSHASGYSFSGWKINGTGDTKSATDTTTINAATNLVAQWEEPTRVAVTVKKDGDTYTGRSVYLGNASSSPSVIVPLTYNATSEKYEASSASNSDLTSGTWYIFEGTTDSETLCGNAQTVTAKTGNTLDTVQYYTVQVVKGTGVDTLTLDSISAQTSKVVRAGTTVDLVVSNLPTHAPTSLKWNYSQTDVSGVNTAAGTVGEVYSSSGLKYEVNATTKLTPEYALNHTLSNAGLTATGAETATASVRVNTGSTGQTPSKVEVFFALHKATATAPARDNIIGRNITGEGWIYGPASGSTGVAASESDGTYSASFNFSGLDHYTDYVVYAVARVTYGESSTADTGTPDDRVSATDTTWHRVYLVYDGATGGSNPYGTIRYNSVAANAVEKASFSLSTSYVDVKPGQGAELTGYPATDYTAYWSLLATDLTAAGDGTLSATTGTPITYTATSETAATDTAAAGNLADVVVQVKYDKKPGFAQVTVKKTDSSNSMTSYTGRTVTLVDSTDSSKTYTLPEVESSGVYNSDNVPAGTYKVYVNGRTRTTGDDETTAVTTPEDTGVTLTVEGDTTNAGDSADAAKPTVNYYTVSYGKATYDHAKDNQSEPNESKDWVDTEDNVSATTSVTSLGGSAGDQSVANGDLVVSGSGVTFTWTNNSSVFPYTLKEWDEDGTSFSTATSPTVTYSEYKKTITPKVTETTYTLTANYQSGHITSIQAVRTGPANTGNTNTVGLTYDFTISGSTASVQVPVGDYQITVVENAANGVFKGFNYSTNPVHVGTNEVVANVSPVYDDGTASSTTGNKGEYTTDRTLTYATSGTPARITGDTTFAVVTDGPSYTFTISDVTTTTDPANDGNGTQEAFTYTYNGSDAPTDRTPGEQTVTVTNTSNVKAKFKIEVTDSNTAFVFTQVDFSAAGNTLATALNAADAASGKTATFKVKPKDGLKVGEYTATFKVIALKEDGTALSEEVSATYTAKVTVSPKPIGARVFVLKDASVNTSTAAPGAGDLTAPDSYTGDEKTYDAVVDAKETNDATAGYNYKVTNVVWTPVVSEKFADRTFYKVTVTATASEDYVFAASNTEGIAYGINGQTTASGTYHSIQVNGNGAGNTVTMTYLYPMIGNLTGLTAAPTTGYESTQITASLDPSVYGPGTVEVTYAIIKKTDAPSSTPKADQIINKSSIGTGVTFRKVSTPGTGNNYPVTFGTGAVGDPQLAPYTEYVVYAAVQVTDGDGHTRYYPAETTAAPLSATAKTWHKVIVKSEDTEKGTVRKAAFTSHTGDAIHDYTDGYYVDVQDGGTVTVLTADPAANKAFQKWEIASGTTVGTLANDTTSDTNNDNTYTMASGGDATVTIIAYFVDSETKVWVYDNGFNPEGSSDPSDTDHVITFVNEWGNTNLTKIVATKPANGGGNILGDPGSTVTIVNKGSEDVTIHVFPEADPKGFTPTPVVLNFTSGGTAGGGRDGSDSSKATLKPGDKVTFVVQPKATVAETVKNAWTTTYNIVVNEGVEGKETTQTYTANLIVQPKLIKDAKVWNFTSSISEGATASPAAADNGTTVGGTNAVPDSLNHPSFTVSKVEWSPAVGAGGFQAGTAYKVTVTLTADENHAFVAGAQSGDWIAHYDLLQSEGGATAGNVAASTGENGIQSTDTAAKQVAKAGNTLVLTQTYNVVTPHLTLTGTDWYKAKASVGTLNITGGIPGATATVYYALIKTSESDARPTTADQVIDIANSPTGNWKGKVMASGYDYEFGSVDGTGDDLEPYTNYTLYAAVQITTSGGDMPAMMATVSKDDSTSSVADDTFHKIYVRTKFDQHKDRKTDIADTLGTVDPTKADNMTKISAKGGFIMGVPHLTDNALTGLTLKTGANVTVGETVYTLDKWYLADGADDGIAGVSVDGSEVSGAQHGAITNATSKTNGLYTVSGEANGAKIVYIVAQFKEQTVELTITNIENTNEVAEKIFVDTWGSGNTSANIPLITEPTADRKFRLTNPNESSVWVRASIGGTEGFTASPYNSGTRFELARGGHIDIDLTPLEKKAVRSTSYDTKYLFQAYATEDSTEVLTTAEFTAKLFVKPALIDSAAPAYIGKPDGNVPTDLHNASEVTDGTAGTGTPQSGAPTEQAALSNDSDPFTTDPIYTVTDVTWTPSGSGTPDGLTVYTVEVTLKADDNFAFQQDDTNTQYTLNGKNADTDGVTVTPGTKGLVTSTADADYADQIAKAGNTIKLKYTFDITKVLPTLTGDGYKTATAGLKSFNVSELGGAVTAAQVYYALIPAVTWDAMNDTDKSAALSTAAGSLGDAWVKKSTDSVPAANFGTLSNFNVQFDDLNPYTEYVVLATVTLTMSDSSTKPVNTVIPEGYTDNRDYTYHAVFVTVKDPSNTATLTAPADSQPIGVKHVDGTLAIATDTNVGFDKWVLYGSNDTAHNYNKDTIVWVSPAVANGGAAGQVANESLYSTSYSAPNGTTYKYIWLEANYSKEDINYVYVAFKEEPIANAAYDGADYAHPNKVKLAGQTVAARNATTTVPGAFETTWYKHDNAPSSFNPNSPTGTEMTDTGTKFQEGKYYTVRVKVYPVAGSQYTADTTFEFGDPALDSDVPLSRTERADDKTDQGATPVTADGEDADDPTGAYYVWYTFGPTQAVRIATVYVNVTEPQLETAKSTNVSFGQVIDTKGVTQTADSTVKDTVTQEVEGANTEVATLTWTELASTGNPASDDFVNMSTSTFVSGKFYKAAFDVETRGDWKYVNSDPDFVDYWVNTKGALNGKSNTEADTEGKIYQVKVTSPAGYSKDTKYHIEIIFNPLSGSKNVTPVEVTASLPVTGATITGPVDPETEGKPYKITGNNKWEKWDPTASGGNGAWVAVVGNGSQTYAPDTWYRLTSTVKLTTDGKKSYYIAATGNMPDGVSDQSQFREATVTCAIGSNNGTAPDNTDTPSLTVTRTDGVTGYDENATYTMVRKWKTEPLSVTPITVDYTDPVGGNVPDATPAYTETDEVTIDDTQDTKSTVGTDWYRIGASVGSDPFSGGTEMVAQEGSTTDKDEFAPELYYRAKSTVEPVSGYKLKEGDKVRVNGMEVLVGADAGTATVGKDDDDNPTKWARAYLDGDTGNVIVEYVTQAPAEPTPSKVYGASITEVYYGATLYHNPAIPHRNGTADNDPTPGGAGGIGFNFTESVSDALVSFSDGSSKTLGDGTGDTVRYTLVIDTDAADYAAGTAASAQSKWTANSGDDRADMTLTAGTLFVADSYIKDAVAYTANLDKYHGKNVYLVVNDTVLTDPLGQLYIEKLNVIGTNDDAGKVYPVGTPKLSYAYTDNTFSALDTGSATYQAGGEVGARVEFNAKDNAGNASDKISVTYPRVPTLAADADQTKQPGNGETYWFAWGDSKTFIAHGDALPDGINGKKLYIGYTDVNGKTVYSEVGTITIGDPDASNAIVYIVNTSKANVNADTEYGDTLEAIPRGYKGDIGDLVYLWQRLEKLNNNSYAWVDVKTGTGSAGKTYAATSHDDVGKFFRVLITKENGIDRTIDTAENVTLASGGAATSTKSSIVSLADTGETPTIADMETDYATKAANLDDEGVYTSRNDTSYVYVDRKTITAEWSWTYNGQTPGVRGWDNTATAPRGDADTGKNSGYANYAYTGPAGSLYSDQKVVGDDADFIALTKLNNGDPVFANADSGEGKEITFQTGDGVLSDEAAKYYKLVTVKPTGDVEADVDRVTVTYNEPVKDGTPDYDPRYTWDNEVIISKVKLHTDEGDGLKGTADIKWFPVTVANPATDTNKTGGPIAAEFNTPGTQMADDEKYTTGSFYMVETLVHPLPGHGFLPGDKMAVVANGVTIEKLIAEYDVAAASVPVVAKKDADGKNIGWATAQFVDAARSAIRVRYIAQTAAENKVIVAVGTTVSAPQANKDVTSGSAWEKADTTTAVNDGGVSVLPGGLVSAGDVDITWKKASDGSTVIHFDEGEVYTAEFDLESTKANGYYFLDDETNAGNEKYVSFTVAGLTQTGVGSTDNGLDPSNANYTKLEVSSKVTDGAGTNKAYKYHIKVTFPKTSSAEKIDQVSVTYDDPHTTTVKTKTNFKAKVYDPPEKVWMSSDGTSDNLVVTGNNYGSTWYTGNVTNTPTDPVALDNITGTAAPDNFGDDDYTVVATFRARPGYQFDSSTKFFINGVEADSSHKLLLSDGVTAAVWHTFPGTNKVINRVEATVAQPTSGGKISTSVTKGRVYNTADQDMRAQVTLGAATWYLSDTNAYENEGDSDKTVANNTDVVDGKYYSAVFDVTVTNPYKFLETFESGEVQVADKAFLKLLVNGVTTDDANGAEDGSNWINGANNGSNTKDSTTLTFEETNRVSVAVKPGSKNRSDSDANQINDYQKYTVTVRFPMVGGSNDALTVWGIVTEPVVGTVKANSGTPHQIRVAEEAEYEKVSGKTLWQHWVKVNDDDGKAPDADGYVDTFAWQNVTDDSANFVAGDYYKAVLRVQLKDAYKTLLHFVDGQGGITAGYINDTTAYVAGTAKKASGVGNTVEGEDMKGTKVTYWTDANTQDATADGSNPTYVQVERVFKVPNASVPTGFNGFSGLVDTYYAATVNDDGGSGLSNVNRHNVDARNAATTTYSEIDGKIPGDKETVPFAFTIAGITGTVTYSDGTTTKSLVASAGTDDATRLYYDATGATGWHLGWGTSTTAATVDHALTNGYIFRDATVGAAAPTDMSAGSNDSRKFNGQDVYLVVGTTVLGKVGTLTVKQLWVENLAVTGALTKVAYTIGETIDLSGITGAVAQFNLDSMRTQYTMHDHVTSSMSLLSLTDLHAEYYYQLSEDGTAFTDFDPALALTAGANGKTLYLCYTDVNDHTVRVPLGILSVTAAPTQKIAHVNVSVPQPIVDSTPSNSVTVVQALSNLGNIVTTKVTPSNVKWYPGATGGSEFTGDFVAEQVYRVEFDLTANDNTLPYLNSTHATEPDVTDVSFVISAVGPIVGIQSDVAGNTVITKVSTSSSTKDTKYHVVVVYEPLTGGKQPLIDVVVEASVPADGVTKTGPQVTQPKPYNVTGSNNKWYYWNGTDWAEVDTNTGLDNGKFLPGTDYMVISTVELTDTTHYEITDATKFYQAGVERTRNADERPAGFAGGKTINGNQILTSATYPAPKQWTVSSGKYTMINIFSVPLRTIDHVSVRYNEPEAGKKPTDAEYRNEITDSLTDPTQVKIEDALVNNGTDPATVTLKGSKWDDHNLAGNTATFVGAFEQTLNADKKYTVQSTIQAKDGYMFTDDTWFTINGETVKKDSPTAHARVVSVNATEAVLRYEFTISATGNRDVIHVDDSFKNVPVIGEVIEGPTGVTEQIQTNHVGTKWYTGFDKTKFEANPDAPADATNVTGGTFLPNTKYTVVTTVTPKTGWQYLDDTTHFYFHFGTDDTHEVTKNGANADHGLYEKDGKWYMYWSFTTPENVNIVDVEVGYKVPVSGESPAVDLYWNPHAQVDLKHDGLVKTDAFGSTWHTGAVDGTAIDGSDTFGDGDYTVLAHFKANPGFVFTNATKFTVNGLYTYTNGVPADVTDHVWIKDDGSEAYVWHTFPGVNKVIVKVAADVTQPVANGIVTDSVTELLARNVPDQDVLAHVDFGEVSWGYGSSFGGTYTDVDTTTDPDNPDGVAKSGANYLFLPNLFYEATFTVEAKDGYTFQEEGAADAPDKDWVDFLINSVYKDAASNPKKWIDGADTATLNGIKVTTTLDTSKTKYTIKVDFPVTGSKGNVLTVWGFADPKAGDTIMVADVITDVAAITVRDTEPYKIVDGTTLWEHWDGSNWVAVNNDDTFLPGDYYRASLTTIMKPEYARQYQFTETTDGYVNDTEAFNNVETNAQAGTKVNRTITPLLAADDTIQLRRVFRIPKEKVVVKVKSIIPTTSGAGSVVADVDASIDYEVAADAAKWEFTTKAGSIKGWFKDAAGTEAVGTNFTEDPGTYFLVVTVKPKSANYELYDTRTGYEWYSSTDDFQNYGNSDPTALKWDGTTYVTATGDGDGSYRVAFRYSLGGSSGTRPPMVEIAAPGFTDATKTPSKTPTSSNNSVQFVNSAGEITTTDYDVEWYEDSDWVTGTPMAATATFKEPVDPNPNLQNGTSVGTRTYTVKIHVSKTPKDGAQLLDYLDGQGLFFNYEDFTGTTRPAELTANANKEYNMFKYLADGGELYVVHTWTFTKTFVHTHTEHTSPGTGGGGGGGTTEVKLPVVYYKLRDLGVTNDLTAEKMTKVSGDKPKAVPKVTGLEGLKFLGWSETDPDKVSDPSKITLVDPTTVTIKKDDKIFYAVYEKVTGEVKTGFDHTHYVIGFPDGTFAPDANITRGQVATIVARSCLEGFVEGSDYGNPGNYSDVTEHWAYSAISYCYMHGAMNGYEDGTFRPDRYITRQELSNVVARLAGMQTGTVTEFTDADQIAAWAMNGVYTMVSKGWVNGYKEDDGTYTIRPERNITRAETVKIFNRLLNRGTDQEGLKNMIEYIHTGVASNNTENEYTEYMVWPDVVGHWAYYEIIEAANDHDFHGRNTDEKVPPEDWTRVHIDEKWRYYDNADDGADDVGRSLPRLTVTYVVKSNGVIHSSVTETVVKFESPKPENLPTARANEGYRFVGWSKVDPESPAFNQATDLVDPTANYVAEDTIFYAVFQPN